MCWKYNLLRSFAILIHEVWQRFEAVRFFFANYIYLIPVGFLKSMECSLLLNLLGFIIAPESSKA